MSPPAPSGSPTESLPSNADRVIVVGAGLAGLAAAVGLAKSGRSVLLLESRPRLGGRASSFVDPATKTEIDNCQHVSMGCCTNFRHFCELTGLSEHLRRETTLHFLSPKGTVNRFAATSVLPTPFHLGPAFGSLDYLTRREKWSLGRNLSRLARWNPDRSKAGTPEESIEDWLHRRGESQTAIRRFWEVVLVSALSEDLSRISVGHARKVFVEGFLACRDGWTVEIPTVPLSRFYGEELSAWFTDHGVEVRTGCGVREVVTSIHNTDLHSEHERVTGVRLRTGEFMPAAAVVLAVPQYLAGKLLPPTLAETEEIRNLDHIETAPIASVHLWWDRLITDLPHAVLIDRVGQWIFHRGSLLESPRDSDRFLYQVVISASRDLPGNSTEDVMETIERELRDLFPAAREASVLHRRMIVEKRAVFSVTSDVEQYRLPQRTSIPNLQLAGDWTRTDWPATMEGAVKSGFLAAENLLHQNLSQDGSVVRPRLVRSGVKSSILSRVLFGLPGENGPVRERESFASG